MDTSTSSTTTDPLPMVPLSALDIMAKQAIGNSKNTSTMSSSSLITTETSVEITIVTTEAGPEGPDGSITTIDRELKLRLRLPQAYAAKEIKSLNVKLHRNIPVSGEGSCQQQCSPSLVPSSIIPEKSYSNTCISPEVVPSSPWQQQQHHLFQDQSNELVTPDRAPSSSSSSISPSPEPVVSSTSMPLVTPNSSPSTGKRRRRQSLRRSSAAAAASSPSSNTPLRKKRRTNAPAQ